MPECILIVDDDEDIRDLFAGYLLGYGYEARAVADGAALLDCLKRCHVDLVLLSQPLAGDDNLTLVQQLSHTNDVGIIIVTDHSQRLDSIGSREVGVDDYITKPVDLREMLARIRTVLKRRQAPPSLVAPLASGARSWRFAGWHLDEASRSLLNPSGDPVALTTGEFDLLLLFVTRPNRVISRDELIDLMYHREAGPFDRAIDVQVARLRRKLDDDPSLPTLIKTVRSAGYLFAARVQS